jgi:ATP-dependent helicase/DNAse subunit B
MCPFTFFLNRVLQAGRPEEPDVVPTPLVRGTLAHQFLALFFAAVRAKGLTAELYGSNALETLRGVFTESLGKVRADRERELGLARDPFWALEKVRIEAMLTGFLAGEFRRLAQTEKKGSRHEPRFFELAFGVGRRHAADADGASTQRPVPVELRGAVEYITGRIDRVDYVAGADSPQAVIIDYKLSSRHTAGEVERLSDMQMPSYLYAAPLAVPDKGVVPVGALYRVIKDGSGLRFVASFQATAAYDEFRKRFAAELHARAASVRSGRFQAESSRDCPSYCPGRGICRGGERGEEEEGDE